jgi:phage terminase large subunit-like protein
MRPPCGLRCATPTPRSPQASCPRIGSWRGHARSRLERYHLNRWSISPDHWISPELWAARADDRGLPPDGADVVLGFDGSDRRDATALAGCTPDGYVFRVASWERDTNDPDWTVPRIEADAAVTAAMARWHVLEFDCDPPGWQAEIEAWEREWPGIVVRFDTGVPARMGPACDRFYSAVVAGELTHDGDPILARHVANCRTRETRYGRLVTKASKDSPDKIDLAVAAVVAYSASRAERAPVFRSNYETQGLTFATTGSL